VVVAAEGGAAAELALRTDFDLILMDCEMPGTDGYTATGRVRAHEAGGNRQTPIIGMSVYVDTESCERCRDAGMDEVLSKPILPEALEALLKRRFSR